MSKFRQLYEYLLPKAYIFVFRNGERVTEHDFRLHGEI
jgi:hypothetical protein